MLSFISPETGEFFTAQLELISLAIPRRTCMENQLQHVIDTFKKVGQRKENLRGLTITKQSWFLRHFTCDFELIGDLG